MRPRCSGPQGTERTWSSRRDGRRRTRLPGRIRAFPQQARSKSPPRAPPAPLGTPGCALLERAGSETNELREAAAESTERRGEGRGAERVDWGRTGREKLGEPSRPEHCRAPLPLARPCSLSQAHRQHRQSREIHSSVHTVTLHLHLTLKKTQKARLIGHEVRTRMSQTVWGKPQLSPSGYRHTHGSASPPRVDLAQQQRGAPGTRTRV